MNIIRVVANCQPRVQTPWSPRQTSSYPPKDVYKQRQNAKLASWTTRQVKKAVITGVITSVSVGVLAVALVYKTVQDFKARFHFFHDVFQTEQGYDSYIQIKLEQKRRELDQASGVWFPWLSSHSHDPKKLLRLAQSSDHSVRYLGVQALAEEHHWSDADFRMLAQSLDATTMIGLARTKGADHRLFLPPPPIPPSNVSMEEQLGRLLSALPTDNIDRCTLFFTSNALQEGTRAAAEERSGLLSFGANGLAFTESLSSASPQLVQLFCLQALAKHSRAAVWTIDGNDLWKAGAVTAPDDLAPVSLWLHVVLGHTAVASHCPLIVQLGGLQLMRRIHDGQHHSVKLMRQVARVLANLALHRELHADIIEAGWTSVLARWINSKDIALSLHATKALANLDRDFGASRLYPDGVYLYYPQFRYREPVYADIVFVHGLLGGPFRTWRQNDATRPQKKATSHEGEPRAGASTAQEAGPGGQRLEAPSDGGEGGAGDGSGGGGEGGTQTPKAGLRDRMTQLRKWKHKLRGAYRKVKEDANKRTSEALGQTAQEPVPAYTYCWPKDWLAKDCPHVRILTVEYETHLSEWAPKCPYESEKRSLSVRSRDLLQKLRMAGIGDRPIIWVGHSMGGLIIKQMLLMANEDPDKRHLVENSRGIVLYSVPHRGSPLAAYSQHTQYLLYPSVEVQELRQGSPHLLSLHEKFKELLFDVGIPLLSFCEGQKTELPFNLKVMIVPPESSDPEFGEVYKMEDMTHLDICKPSGRDHPLYRLTLDFILDCIPVGIVEHILKANIPEEYILHEDLESDT